MTTVIEIARQNIVTCNITDDVPTVAKKMVDAEVGSIFVKDLGGRIIGLITDGQIFRLVAERENPNRKTAMDIMFKGIQEVDKDASITDAWRVFQETGYKRLAVTNSGKIVGVLRRKIVQRFMRYNRAKSFLKLKSYH